MSLQMVFKPDYSPRNWVVRDHESMGQGHNGAENVPRYVEVHFRDNEVHGQISVISYFRYINENHRLNLIFFTISRIIQLKALTYPY